jgi:hypothetical protein
LFHNSVNKAVSDEISPSISVAESLKKNSGKTIPCGQYSSFFLSFLVFRQSSTTMSSEQQRGSVLARVQFKGHCACTEGPFHIKESPPAKARWETEEHQEYHRQLERSKAIYLEDMAMAARSRATQHLVWELSKVQARDDLCSFEAKLT